MHINPNQRGFESTREYDQASGADQQAAAEGKSSTAEVAVFPQSLKNSTSATEMRKQKLKLQFRSQV